MKSRPDPLLHPGEAGAYLGISASATRWLIDTGRLPAVLTASGHRLVRQSEVERLRADRERRRRPPAARLSDGR